MCGRNAGGFVDDGANSNAKKDLLSKYDKEFSDFYKDKSLEFIQEERRRTGRIWSQKRFQLKTEKNPDRIDKLNRYIAFFAHKKQLFDELLTTKKSIGAHDVRIQQEDVGRNRKRKSSEIDSGTAHVVVDRNSLTESVAEEVEPNSFARSLGGEGPTSQGTKLDSPEDVGRNRERKSY